MKINKSYKQGLKALISSNINNKITQKENNISYIQNTLDKKRKNSFNNSNKIIHNESKGNIPQIKIDIIHPQIPKATKHHRKFSFQYKDGKMPSKDNFNDSYGSYLNSQKIHHNKTNVSFNNNKLRNNKSDINKDNNIFKIYNLKIIIKILLYCINSLKKKYTNCLNLIKNRNSEIIKKLTEEKQFLIKNNKELKTKIIEIIFATKLYENNANLFKNKYLYFLKQIITENNYLKKCYCLTNNINKDYLIKLENQIKAEKIQRQINIINQGNINNLERNNFIIVNKHNTNEFNPLSLKDDILQNKHKRQKTHFNLGILNDDDKDNYYNNEIKSITDESNSYDNLDHSLMNKNDLINKELKEMTINYRNKKKNSKTKILEKTNSLNEEVYIETKKEKKSNSEKNILNKNISLNNKENKDNNSINEKNIEINKKNHQSLCYRTFKEKIKKK